MKIGIFRDPDEVYSSLEHIRCSALKGMATSPGHFLHLWKGPKVQKKAWDLGRAVHSVLLEQSLDGFVRRPDGVDGRTKDGKAQLEALAATGKIVITGEEHDSMEQRLGTFAGSSEAMICYDNSFVEMSHYAQDPVTGLYIKARPDIQRPGFIADLKTTANMGLFEKQIWNYGYHIQAGFYSLVTEITTGEQVTEFKFIAQEKTAPYGVRVFSFDKATIAFCKEKARELLNRASVCIKEDRFPIYDDVVKKIVPPMWVYGDEFNFEEAI
jgi:hypothetical protein